jgi:hypothetical protein
VSTRTKRGRRTPGAPDPTFDPPAESSEPAEFEDGAPASPEHSAPFTDRDYFDDPVPFPRDAELREREERMRRLEAARPRRRSRRLKARMGIIAAVGVVLVAGGLSVLGRSAGRKATDARSSPQQSTGAVEPAVVAHRRVASPQAAAVAAPHPKPRRHGSSHGRHRRRRRHRDGGTRARGDKAEAPTESVSAPEIVEEERTAEAVTAAPPAPEPEPVTEPGPTTSEQTGVATEGEPHSPGDEATRQFGFGR